VGRYIDRTSGRTADDLVTYALSHNLELQAARKEIDAAKAMVKQARLRANPKVDIGASQNVTGTDHTIDVGGVLPLELGGRRPARITVAEREVEVREREFANRERLLASEVRMKFGEALAQSLKLSLTDERIESNQQSFNLVAARVTEGATPPLEQNMVLVELNRLRSLRETAEGKLESLILELKNVTGMSPE
jgi:cobalt-zinc-cadmium efflux system outer membrane protein